MSYPDPNHHQYAQHYAAQQAYAQQQMPRQQQINPRQQQQQRAMQAGRGVAPGAHPAAAAAGRYGPGPAGMQTYPQQAQKASPRGRGTAMPKGGMPGMPTHGYPPGAKGVGTGATAVSKGANAGRSEGPVDYEFLDLISEILRLVEQGFSTNSDAVKEKVNQLQEKFARAKVALDRMDGAEMTPQMQEEMFDLYQNRLKHLNGMLGTYSQLPVFDPPPS